MFVLFGMMELLRLHLPHLKIVDK